MMCQRIGRPPMSTSGLGRNSVSSRRRVPNPPQRTTTFIEGSRQRGADQILLSQLCWTLLNSGLSWRGRHYYDVNQLVLWLLIQVAVGTAVLRPSDCVGFLSLLDRHYARIRGERVVEPGIPLSTQQRPNFLEGCRLMAKTTCRSATKHSAQVQPSLDTSFQVSEALRCCLSVGIKALCFAIFLSGIFQIAGLLK